MSATKGRTPALLAVVALALSLMATSADAAVTEPRLKLRAGSSNVTLTRYGSDPVYLDLGVYVTAMSAPFELRAIRPDYSQPIQLSQVLYAEDDSVELRSLPSDVLDGWNGLAHFFEYEIADAEGNPVGSTESDFCPNGPGRERISDDGPMLPSYTDGCYANPFTRGMVWGIDPEWAVSSVGYEAPLLNLPKGTFEATVSISDSFAELFEIDPADASVTIDLTVKKTKNGGCNPYCGRSGKIARQRARSMAVPIMEEPDDALLPDLIALPAWGITVENKKNGRSFINFGATVWTGGASSMVVEGFRRSDEDVMDAYQYFFENDEVIGRAPVGEMEYDPRSGHEHWHFLQFAAYSLLGSDQVEIVKSKKEAFCLAPTDPIDLSLPGAVFNPGEIGLGSACGQKTSIWTREILPLGWGDTYFQGLPGQSFNITNLPNGTYYIEVEANPAGFLHEQTADNNVELREIQIKGKKGNRRVVVPPWNGIDTENPFGTGGGHSH